MFDEANAVEEFILERMVDLGWNYVFGPELPRTNSDVLLASILTEAMCTLNPEIAVDPSRADEVVYKLRAVIQGVAGDGLVRANEELMAWVRGERTMPFGPNGEHATIRLVDFDEPSANVYTVSNQVTFTQGPQRRFDLVAFVNGIPLVAGEAKTPVRPAVSWVDGAAQVHDDYEVNVPSFFVPNVLSFASEGKTFRFGAIRMPIELWAPWRAGAGTGGGELAGLEELDRAVSSLLRPAVVLDIAQNFTLFATDRQHRKIKLICRYQQYEATNQVVERVVEGRIRKGLIWHFQGSGKSLLMVFAANKLRLHPELGNPTVLIVVDRIDLDTQITATFNATDVPNTVTAQSREELQTLLANDSRKVIITTIHKFAEAGGVLNDRGNIVVLVDEAHRTQEGDLGREMRDSLPNACLFGLTGTPINQRDHNTFYAFGAVEDAGGYMSRYSFEESIRDKATLPLRFETRAVKLRIGREALDEEFAKLTEGLTEEDRAEVSRQAGKFALLVKAPARVAAVVEDIAQHYEERIAPEGFGAQVVTIDQEACVLYKKALDLILPPEVSEVVISVGQGAPQEWRDRFRRSKDEEERLLDRFRDPSDPLKILIVTAKLLTGFDAPNLQCMYLDKPMRDHGLLQAICRTNRPAPGKSYGLIVDYLGIFDDVAQALVFDEQSITTVISNLDELKAQLGPFMAACLTHFPGVDRAQIGWEGLLAAQQCLPDNERRDAFAADFSRLAIVWEAVSPDPVLSQYEEDYRWLAQVYESLKPPSGNGKLLWHALGAKTIELIHSNVTVQAVRDDLETLVLDADVIDELYDDPEAGKVQVEVKISIRLRRHGNDPKFVALSERLEHLRLQHEQGVLASIDFLKGLLSLAKDVVEAEREVPADEQEDRGRAALTELFESVKNPETPVIVERVVTDIDEIVRQVRFPGWQQTAAGEREVQRALRKSLLKYKLHADQELFDRAYGYIVQYY